MESPPPNSASSSGETRDSGHLVPAELSPSKPSSGGGLRLLRRLLLLVFLLGIVGMGAMMFALASGLSTIATADSTSIQEKHHSLARRAANKVVILRLEDTILDGEAFKKQLDKLSRDKAVKAFVLRVDSPGGTVTASDYIYHHLKKVIADRDIPMVVSMGAIAASGGYYVAMAVGDEEDTIYAEPTTWTGSIGVIIPHYNIAGLLERWDIEDDSIKSAELKAMGSPTKKLTPAERAILQGLVDDSFSRFKDVVRYGRPRLRDNDEQLDAVATGQVFTTRQALENGLVDKEGFLEDAIDRALELAQLDKDNTSVVEYVRPKSLIDVLSGAQAYQQSPELKLLTDSLTPRAWYLFTWPAN